MAAATAPASPIDNADVASWTGEAGDPAGARDLFAQLLPDIERVLGPKHPDTLTTRRNLAHWTREANRAKRSG